MRTIWVSLIGMVVAVGWAGPAGAQCGTFNGTSGNDEIVIGEEQLFQAGIWVGVNIGICSHQVGTSTWTWTSMTGCTGSAMGDLIVNAGAGNDVVTFHTGADAACPTNPPSGTSRRMHQLNRSLYDMLISIRGGTGSDRLYALAGNNELFANNTSFTADSSADVMCGGSGDDDIYGDLDGTTSSSAYDCMGGGSGGNDYCDSRDTSCATGSDWDGHWASCTGTGDTVAPTPGCGGGYPSSIITVFSARYCYDLGCTMPDLI